MTALAHEVGPDIARLEVRVQNKTHSYGILTGEALLGQIDKLLNLSQYSGVFIVTDQNLEKIWLEKLLSSLPQNTPYIVLPPGEAAKHLDSVELIWTAMQRAGCDRKTLVLNLGGGVIGDMGGFAASTYMRGVDFVHLPTTLLAQVDSSIGGKTGIDAAGIKNLVGTFAQPISVIIDTATLHTLPKRELTSGFAEMIKHALIQDKTYLDALMAKRPEQYSPTELSKLVGTSNRIKAAIVSRDETEGGERKILNFGHTVGHAFEALSLDTTQPLLHGEAVSIGMVIEAELSRACDLLSTADVVRIKDALQTAGLPIRAPHFALTDILQKMRGDKKNTGGVLRFTLLDGIGKAVYDQIVEAEAITRIITRNMETNNV